MKEAKGLRAQVTYMKDVEKLSFRQMEKRIGISRNALSKIYSGNWEEHRIQREFVLDAYRDLITNWYQECSRLKAIQVHRRLIDRGVSVDYTTVARYTRKFRKKPKERIHWPLEFLPGEEGQVDWFFVTHEKLGKLCGFVMILSYSRYMFAHLFPRHAFEFFIEGHLMALGSFGGCPHALRYDNLKSVVLKRQPITYNPGFVDFARHFGFEIRLCNVAAGNEKGRVERVIRTMRDTFFNVANSHLSLKAINADLHNWVERKNNTIHRVTLSRPVDKLKEEKLMPLPDGKWINTTLSTPKKPNKVGLIVFDNNYYSYPDYLGRNEIIVRALVDTVELLTLDQRKVATHVRSFEKMKNIINPMHRTVSRLTAPAKRERILSIIRNLDPAIDKFLKETSFAGEDTYLQSYEIFKLLRSNSKTAVISAVREAISKKLIKISYIKTLLEPPSMHMTSEVMPQDQRLLDIDYKPRPLECYDGKSNR